MSSNFFIPQQTEAEADQFLIDCFHDANFIKSLLDNKFSIITGRKGTGKTALTKYLHNKYSRHDIAFAHRISIDELSTVGEPDEVADSIVLYLITRTAQLFLQKDFFDKKGENFWKDFLESNGLQLVADYKTFTQWGKNNIVSVKIPMLIGGKLEERLDRCSISVSIPHLARCLGQALITDEILLIFADDLSDHLDRSDRSVLKKSINIIRDVLLKLDKINNEFSDLGLNLRYVSCIRDDLFDYMEGSNINKLQNNSLKLSWDEKSVCSLLIKRLPFYQDNLDEALLDPIGSILKQFPDKIFSSILGSLGATRYSTNFYAYMLSISFNRPRDFLKFCYTLRDRLSTKHPVEFKNIDSAEIEYSEYFIKELKDELYITSQLLGFEADTEGINRLIAALAKDTGFKFSELRINLASYLGIKASHQKVVNFLKELWAYGIVGYQDQGKGRINFKYIKGCSSPVFDTSILKPHQFYLHRGMWWSLKKKRFV